MKDAVQRLNAEYGLNLTEEEMEVIARQAEAARRLVQRLYEVDVEGVVPALRIDPEERR
jgi:Asp-tRNA(Asn)/Glu-tRNA(Gln) amidotransferase C subunit